MPEFERWFGDNGDETRLLDHDLDSNSIVFEVWGYTGEFSEQIYNKFNCNLYVFEPISEFCEQLKGKFEKTEKVFVFNYGLSSSDCETEALIDKDNGENSTLLEREIITNANIQKITLKKVDNVLELNNIDYIDLFSLNIEGGEYSLLEYMVTSPIISRIKNIQIQFHDFVEYAHARRSAIQMTLRETHELTYNYDFVWENWTLK